MVENQKNKFKIIDDGFIAWGGALMGFYLIGMISDLEDVLNYSEAGILTLLVFYFLIFGSISNLENFIDAVKTRIENFVYRKNINLEKELVINKQRLAVVEKGIAK